MPRRNDKYGSQYGKGGTVPPVVNLAKAALFVARKAPFEASLCCGCWVTQVMPMDDYPLNDEVVIRVDTRRSYIVYTGTPEHRYPLFVYDEHAAVWFENTDSLYGTITTKQRKRLRPNAETTKFDATTVEAIARYGFAHVAKLRLQRKGKRSWQDELRSYMSAYAYGGTITGRMSGKSKTAQQIIDEWRAKHVVNGGPSMQQIYDELIALNGGKKQ